MPDLEELQLINQTEVKSNKGTIQTQETYPIDIALILTYLEHKAKVILLFILLSVLASCLILDGSPSPQARAISDPSSRATDNDQPFTSQTFPSMDEHIPETTIESAIPQLVSDVRKALDEIIDKSQPTAQQLDALREMVLEKKKKIETKIAHQKKRSQFFYQKSKLEYFAALAMEKYNGDPRDPELQQSRKKAEEKEFNDMNYNYHFDRLKTEIPICIVAYALNTKKMYASDYFLTSISNQNYSNYRVVVVLDDRGEELQDMWKTSVHYANSSKVELVINEEKIGYWESIKLAINSPCCGKAEVIALMNGNDQLLGFNVFSSLNAVYQLKEANVAYSNFIEYHKEYNQLFRGFSGSYSPEQITNSRYRETSIQFGSILTFRKHLFSYIRDDSVQVSSEHSTQFASQIALIFSILELSCGKVEYIPEYYYLFEGYKFMGNNKEVLQNYLKILKALQPYTCYKYMVQPK